MLGLFFCAAVAVSAAEPAASLTSEQQQIQVLVDREKGGRERLERALADSARKAHAAFEEIQRRADEAHAEQKRRSAARRKMIEERGGYRAFAGSEAERLRRFAASAPPPQAQPALLAAERLLSEVSPCLLGQPVIFDAPETVEPERSYQLSGCNLASGYPTAPKVTLVIDTGTRFELFSGIITSSAGPLPEEQKDDSITINTPTIEGVFDGPARIVLTTADGKTAETAVSFRAARTDRIVQPPTLLGECSGAADTNHCAGGGGKVFNSFVAYHHRVCCGWVGGNDHYFLPAPLAKGWTVSFRDVFPYSAGTGSSCGPAGGPGHITAIEGADLGGASVDVRVHWNTAWMCSELMYIGQIFVIGPKGTSPF
jgi:hypothetical protein